jgi:hypothetical protein
MISVNYMKKIVSKIFSLSLLVAPVIGMAQTTPITPSTVDTSGVPTTAVGVLAVLYNILGWMRTIFFIVAVGFILYAAFIYLQAGGDPEKLKEAKNMTIYAVVAIVVALLAAAMPAIVSSVL